MYYRVVLKSFKLLKSTHREPFELQVYVLQYKSSSVMFPQETFLMVWRLARKFENIISAVNTRSTIFSTFFLLPDQCKNIMDRYERTVITRTNSVPCLLLLNATEFCCTL